MPDDTRDRLIAVEVELKHLTETLAKMSAQVETLHDLMHAAKGARWAILGVSGLAGFLSGKAGGLLTGFLGK